MSDFCRGVAFWGFARGFGLFGSGFFEGSRPGCAITGLRALSVRGLISA